MPKTIVKISKTHPLLETVCSYCATILEKKSEAFVCGSWSNYGYTWFCSKDCAEKAGYKVVNRKTGKKNS